MHSLPKKPLLLLIGLLVIGLMVEWVGPLRHRAEACPPGFQDVVNGACKETLATTLSGEDVVNGVMKVEQRFSYKNIATQATTTVKSGPGFLHTMTFNKALANGVVQCFDNTAGSGTSILLITQPASVLNSFGTLTYDVTFGTGLTCVTSGATQDLTLSFR